MQVDNKHILSIIKQIILNYRALEKNGLGFPKRKYEMEKLGPVSADKIIHAKRLRDLKQITQPKGRSGAKVNLEAIYVHGTIEFREHSGSTKSTDIFAWMGFIDSLVGQSKTMVLSTGAPHEPDIQELEVLKEMHAELQSKDSCVLGSTALQSAQREQVHESYEHLNQSPPQTEEAQKEIDSHFKKTSG
jgi:hypothetical protein